MMSITEPPPATEPQASEQTGLIPGPLCVDTHVHVYRAFDHETFLDAAADNAKRLGRGLGVIMLTETRGEHVFRQWHDRNRVGAWTFNPNEEDFVMFAQRDGELALAVIAGRQIITQERLEVLALGVDAEFEYGRPIAETVSAVRGRDALPVVPYGFGKWTGERGQIISRLIELHADHGLVLGDNGGRPTLGPRPPHFDQAAAHRVTILPGTDPLPLRSCQRQACRFGVRLDGTFRRETLGREVKTRLAAAGPVPPRFGDHVSLPRAVYQQLALRLDRKLFKGKGVL